MNCPDRPLVLAVETSCDETAAAVLGRDGALLASGVASQMALHNRYGGVVPEVASREHLRQLAPVVGAVLREARIAPADLDVVAATSGPGLATSLMTGAAAAKGLALGLGKPFLGINHLEGHLLSPFFAHRRPVERALGLVVSGGHTLLVDVETSGRYRLLGQTRDDAAGEAFDKVAKLLGLPYPGGPEIDRHARRGRRDAFDFPRSMLHSGDHAFSFSGLKTAVRYMLPKLGPGDLDDVCASFQEAVVDVLVGKTLLAARAQSHSLLAVSGGVCCNTRLRERFQEEAAAVGLELLLSDAALSTDNAAMIAFVAAERWMRGERSELSEDIDPNLRLATC